VSDNELNDGARTAVELRGQGCRRRVKGDGGVMGGGQQCGGGAVGAMGDCRWQPWRRWWQHGGGSSGKKYPLLMAKNVLGPD
jgi:hypothetical protein